MRSMNVLSLFDGISCGRVALERVGVKVDNYFASEIDKDAIKVSKDNWPDIQQIGDVTKVRGADLPKIDLLIGGSPCQDLSNANNNGKGLEGAKSSLFWEFVRLMKETKPKYFLLENVGGMDTEDGFIISKALDCSPLRIDSALVSAQMRDRLYWTNIPGGGTDLFGGQPILQPEDKKTMLQDILEYGYTEKEKARCLLVSDSRPLRTPSKMAHRYFDTGFTQLVFRNSETVLRAKEATAIGYAEISDNQAIDLSYPTSTTRRGRAMKEKVHTLMHAKNEYYVFQDGDLRYLTQLELERCQTLPEGYTKVLSRDRAAACIGNGWTVDVIVHIFQGLK